MQQISKKNCVRVTHIARIVVSFHPLALRLNLLGVAEVWPRSARYETSPVPILCSTRRVGVLVLPRRSKRIIPSRILIAALAAVTLEQILIRSRTNIHDASRKVAEAAVLE